MSILSTSQAHCRDCYKCLRACPVKAIKVANNHAQIWEDACILDGSCIAVCPQGAKEVASDLDQVRNLLRSKTVVASVAPSFRAAYSGEKARRLGGVLRRLGFADVRSTAEVAGFVAKAHVDHALSVQHPVISSSCPAVVSLVEKHFSSFVGYLAPVVSPLIAQARVVKDKMGSDTAFVFIGPCLAKKQEAQEPQFESLVDGVLSFAELDEWVEEVGIPWMECGADQMVDAPIASRAFPLEGGLVQAAKGASGSKLWGREDLEVMTVSGTEACWDVLKALEGAVLGRNQHLLLEMFACPGGCINGPLMPKDTTELSRRFNMSAGLKQAADASQTSHLEPLADPMLGESWLKRQFVNRPKPWKIPSEEEIRWILAKIGKRNPEDELNCGACGYNTCREKAIAVYNNVAEVQMCIPYMRARAESMAHIILEATPNGIIVTDSSLRIQFINPAAERMFQVRADEFMGRPVDSLVPDNHFANAVKTRRLLIADEVYTEYDLATRQYLLYVPEHDMVLGIFIDVTADARRRQELNELKQATLTRAQQVIDKQMRVAQEIAGLLGETTAETKVLLSKLIKLMQEDAETNGVSGPNGGHTP